VDDGVPPNMVQRVMGHERASTTLDLYTRRTDDADRILRAWTMPIDAAAVPFWCLSQQGPDSNVRIGAFDVVELRGIEPRTSSMRTKRATNCATAP
jgi:hypothetical protein